MARNWHAPWADRGICATDTRFARTLGALDLAPLADVVLLLVIFALIANGFVFKPGIEMEVKTHLPPIEAPAALRGRVLTLTVTAEETVYVDDPARAQEEQARPVAMREALGNQLADFVRRHPEGTVLINADVNARHGYLMQILKIVRDAGVGRIAFGGIPLQAPAETGAAQPTPAGAGR